MVLDHLLRERLGVRIRLLRERELARLDLEHVADRDLVHEVLRRWRAGGRRGLGESNRSEEPASGRDNKGFIHETLHWGKRLDAAWPSNVGAHRLFQGLPESLGSADCSPAASSALARSAVHICVNRRW